MQKRGRKKETHETEPRNPLPYIHNLNHSATASHCLREQLIVYTWEGEKFKACTLETNAKWMKG
jgi:hypothetical protein